MVLGVVMDRGVVVVVVVVVVARGDIAAYFAARFRLVLVLMWRLVLLLVLRTFSVLLRTSMTSLGLGLGAWIVILCLCILSYLEDLSISWLSVQLFAAWSDSWE